MFELVTLHVSDRAASEEFYELVLGTLGRAPHRGPRETGWGDFALVPAESDERVTRRLHIGFGAPTREHVDAFWQAGVDAGYRDDGAPGPRPQYGDDYYGGFLLDPDGNSAEAVHHGAMRTGGAIDHLWIRVADVAEAKRPYVEAGVPLANDDPGHAHFSAGNGSFSLVEGPPTANLDMRLA